MQFDPFLKFLEDTGAKRFGLCMFAPSIMAPAANRLLNQAYVDSGDNLSVPMGDPEKGNIVRYRAGNYSAADLIATKKTAEVLEQIPGAVLLITESGVGAQSRRTLGLLANGQTRQFTGTIHSFYSFAQEFLKVQRIDSGSGAIEEFSNLIITIKAQVTTSEAPAQVLLRTPWEAIFQEIIRDPSRLYRFTKDPRAFEEFIADTYVLDGYNVELTPRSNDGGVDIIATKSGFGAVKIFDHAKAYSTERTVSANDVRAAYGVLSMAQDASKIVITTTSDFAPGVYTEFSPFIPTRLELRHGQKLIDWLKEVSRRE